MLDKAGRGESESGVPAKRPGQGSQLGLWLESLSRSAEEIYAATSLGS